MLEIYKLILSQLNTLGIPCYADLYPKALANAKVYPYIVFNFPNTLGVNYADLNLLQIDIWDNKTSMVGIETISEGVDNIFKSLMFNNEKIFVKTYRDKPYRLKLDEEDNGIQRRQYRYIVKTYKK
jgi:hypothetical protein